MTSAVVIKNIYCNVNRQYLQHGRLLTNKKTQRLRLGAQPPAHQLEIGVEARAPHIGGTLGLVKSGVDFCSKCQSLRE